MISLVYSRRVPLGGCGPIVSFCFDDFPRTALTVGGPILKGFGVVGTYYAAVGLMNTTNHLGEQFHREDLDAVLADGHELASHTFSHISCRSTSPTAFLADIQKGRHAIEQLTGKADSGNFAFPFGEFTLRAKRVVGAEAVSCRSTWNGLNGPYVDLNLLRAYSLYGGRDEHALVRKLILDNEQKKSWLIFYSHDVQDSPSRFGCTPALLEFAVSSVFETSARILTVAEAVAQLASLTDTARVAKFTSSPRPTKELAARRESQYKNEP